MHSAHSLWFHWYDGERELPEHVLGPRIEQLHTEQLIVIGGSLGIVDTHDEPSKAVSLWSILFTDVRQKLLRTTSVAEALPRWLVRQR